jgi:hypothetical protein
MGDHARVTILSLGFCLAAAAQETRGSLSGIVTDTSGAVVPAATLQLTNVETGVALTTVANEAGRMVQKLDLALNTEQLAGWIRKRHADVTR